LCGNENIEITRKNLQEYGKKLLEVNGSDYFADLLIKKAKIVNATIFDGIRPPKVIECIKCKLENSFLLYIESSSECRKKRLMKKDKISESEFLRLSSVPIEKNTYQLKSWADAVIVNDNDELDLFYGELDGIFDSN